MKSYKHNIEKFNKATSGLSATDTMIYLRLLWKLYEDEKTESKCDIKRNPSMFFAL